VGDDDDVPAAVRRHLLSQLLQVLPDTVDPLVELPPRLARRRLVVGVENVDADLLVRHPPHVSVIALLQVRA